MSKFLWMIGVGLVGLSVYVVTMRNNLDVAMADDIKQETRIKALEDKDHEKDLTLQAINTQMKRNTEEIAELKQSVSQLNGSVSDLERTVNRTARQNSNENQQTIRMIQELKQLIKNE